jgi:hypothetical protein
MAIIKDFNEEQQGQQLSGDSGTLSASTGSASSGSATPTATSQGSGWTNLQSYLGANQGQAGGLANQISQNANEKVDTFNKTDTSKSVAEINKGSQSALAGDYAKDVAKNADKVKGFLSSGYGGPDANVYTAGIRNSANQVKDELGQLTNQNYQKATLQRLNNKPTQAYSSGFGALDSFLVGADPNARAKLTMTQGRASEVDNTLNRAQGEINTADTQARQSFDANKNMLRDAARSQYNTLLSGAGTRAEAERASAAERARNEAISNLTGRKTVDKNIANVTYDKVDPFIRANSQFGATDVLTQDELAALNSLSGIDPSLGLSNVKKTDNTAASIDWGGLDNYLVGVSNDVQSRRDTQKAKKAQAAAPKPVPTPTGPAIDFLPKMTINPSSIDEIGYDSNPAQAIYDPNDPLNSLFGVRK